VRAAFEPRPVAFFVETFPAEAALRAAGFFGELFFFFGLAMVAKGAGLVRAPRKGRLIKNVSSIAQAEISGLQPEVPKSKLQAPQKFQAPITSLPRLFWNLGFGDSLELFYELALE
jgi:hypothetical protein